MAERKDRASESTDPGAPITFRVAKWYGYIFAAMFLLYGGVKVLLAFMDHNYTQLAEPLGFLIIGLVLIAPAIAYKELKSWGYWGLVGINGLVVMLALVGLTQWQNLVLMALSGGVLWALLAPATKQYVFGHR